MVDVLSSVDIDAPRNVVAEFAADPDRATEWYVNIKSVDWKTPRPIQIGSRVGFVAHFLGRRLEYVYEITEFVPLSQLVMRTAEGPFPMETTYRWIDSSDGRTRMTLRNRGKPAGFSKLVAPFLAVAMRRATARDLKRLKAILERRR